VTQWNKLKAAGTQPKKIPEFVGYSRATLNQGILPHWGESEKQRVLQVRRQNPSYGKFKIATILKRDFDLEISESHAKPWTFKECVDHMTTTKNGVSVKHFQAWDRCSRFIHAQIYTHATSGSAKRFGLELIQVDGGSEVMGEFEAASELGLELIVLPPASPTKNGGVERGNRIFV